MRKGGKNNIAYVIWGFGGIFFNVFMTIDNKKTQKERNKGYKTP